MPLRYVGRRLTVRLSASTVEVLKVKPGALPGATALAQARAGGAFAEAHQRFWDLARRRLGDAAGTRALVEVLLATGNYPRRRCWARWRPRSATTASTRSLW